MTTTETTHLKTKVAKKAKIIDYLLGLLQTRRTPASAGIRGPSAGSVFMRGSAAAVALAILAYTPSALAWATPAKGMPALLPMAAFTLVLIATMIALIAFMAWQGAMIVQEHGRKRRAASK